MSQFQVNVVITTDQIVPTKHIVFHSVCEINGYEPFTHKGVLANEIEGTASAFLSVDEVADLEVMVCGVDITDWLTETVRKSLKETLLDKACQTAHRKREEARDYEDNMRYDKWRGK